MSTGENGNPEWMSSTGLAVIFHGSLKRPQVTKRFGMLEGSVPNVLGRMTGCSKGTYSAVRVFRSPRARLLTYEKFKSSLSEAR